MDQVEVTLHSALAALSRLLDPVMAWLTRLDFSVEQQLSQWGMPSNWSRTAVLVVWLIVLFMVLKVLPTWLKAIVLLLVALVAMKSYGLLPGG